ATQCRTPQYAAKRSSKAATSGPRTNCALSITLATAASTCGLISLYCAFKSRNGITVYSLNHSRRAFRVECGSRKPKRRPSTSGLFLEERSRMSAKTSLSGLHNAGRAGSQPRTDVRWVQTPATSYGVATPAPEQHLRRASGTTVTPASLPPAGQARRRQFGSDRGRRRPRKLETLQNRSTLGVDYGI